MVPARSFQFTGYVFDNVTNKFTDYEMLFSNCQPFGEMEYGIKGRVSASTPQGLDLSKMHTLLDNHEAREVLASNWTDLQFHLVTGFQNAPHQSQGRSVYETTEGVGCAKARESHGGGVDMCFTKSSVKQVVVPVDNGGSAPTYPAPSAPPSDIDPSNMCKSRERKVTVAEPRAFRAYKLCDDDKCSGKDDCSESGPENNVRLYTCMDGKEGSEGCLWTGRREEAVMYVWSPDVGAQISVQPGSGLKNEMKTAPPPPPPPFRVVNTIPPKPKWPDGTVAWKEDLGKGDKQYKLRRQNGRLVHVLQKAILLCELPGIFELEKASVRGLKLSFQPTAAGACEGSLHRYQGLAASTELVLSREHLNKHVNTARSFDMNGQYITIGSSGTTYRIPVSTETWHTLVLPTTTSYSSCSQGQCTMTTTKPTHAFQSPVPKGTVITTIHTGWSTGTTVTTEHTTTVAATTYQITVGGASIVSVSAQMKKDLPSCAATKTATDHNVADRSCYEAQCTKATSLDSCPTHCAMCTVGLNTLNIFQRLRGPKGADGSPGAIVAEIVANPSSGVFLVQCLETSGDAKNAASIFTPKDVGTVSGCGLEAGWLRGPKDSSWGGLTYETIFGAIASIDSPEAVMVKSATLGTAGPYLTMTIKEAIPGTNATGASTMQGQQVRNTHSIAGAVTAQPSGATLVNYTIKRAIAATESVDNLKCLGNCIDPGLVGTEANPPACPKAINAQMCASTIMLPTQTKAPMNYSFPVYSWQAGGGMFRCNGDTELGSGEVGYANAACTQSVAVPSSAPCWGEKKECSYGWKAKMTLFKDATPETFACTASDSSSSSTSTSTAAQACLFVQVGNLFLGTLSMKPNVEDLSEYYEYTTGNYEENNSPETMWLEGVADASETVSIEPPLSLTMTVPSDVKASDSISGAQYAGKKVIVTFSDGIDEFNSPGLPMYCINKNTGATKPPLIDTRFDTATCMNYKRRVTDPFTEQFDIYPDLSPEVHWEGIDAQGRKWAIKPAEKVIIYPRIAEGNCTDIIENPLEMTNKDGFNGILDLGIGRMRDNMAPLVEWFETNKNDRTKLKVHTGKMVTATNTA